MRRYMLCGLLLIIILLAGCSTSDKNDAGGDVKLPSFQKITVSNPASEVVTFTVSPDGNLYILEAGGLLTVYKNDGTLMHEYENTSDFIAVCWHDGMVYAYDAVKQQIVALDTKDGSIKKITDELKAEEILKLASAGEYIYALAVPEVHNYELGPNGYINFGEILYRINPKTGEVIDTNETNIIAIYAASDGKLYYYAYRDDAYALYTFGTKDGKSAKLYNLDDIGYITAFVYENDYFIYSDHEKVVMLNLSDNTEKVIEEPILILCSNDMTFLKGNIIYFGYYTDKPNAINSVYIEDINRNSHADISDIDNDDKKNKEYKEFIEAAEEKGSVAVSIPFSKVYINSSIVKRISGIKTVFISQNIDNQAVLTEIMAGNPDVDIYITTPASYLAEGVLSKGIYVSLNNSEIIKNYKDKCFDYIADAMTAPSGDIWMLPLQLDSYVIWYIPENIEKFDIDLEEFRYLDDFLKLSERMPRTGNYAAYVETPYLFARSLEDQYDMTYNNFKEKKVNYETPLFRDLFDKMWSGWIMYSPNSRHPLFRSSHDDYKGELMEESARFDKTRVIYKYDSIGEQLNMSSLDGWRVLPMPRLNSDVKKNSVNISCAFINPHSKNKELALEYLEAITKVPFDYWSYTCVLLFKDKEMYADRYDITQPAFEDIYNIVKDGMINSRCGFYINGNIIDDYQNGRLTLDEAIALIQREAEMWLNE